MSRTDNTRPWQIREADKTDVWCLLPYHKQWKSHHCSYCAGSRTRKNGNKRGAIKDQLDNPGADW